MLFRSYAADNGAKIINLSLGSNEPSKTIEDAVHYAYEKGVLITAASGNDGGSVDYPAAFQEVMAVGAIDSTGTKATFSSYGDQLDLVAPGVDIVGCDAAGNLSYHNGTSFAAPYAAGSAALIWSLNPELTNDQVQWILESSATDLGTAGWDDKYGYGALADVS